jgi:uncharacterized Tic20 family protein
MNNITEHSEELTSDSKLLAMFSHFSIFLGGIILPIILYFVQKDKSRFVAFHALQSIFFHLFYAVIIFILVIFLVLILLATGVLGAVFSKHSGSPGAGFFIGMGIFYIGLFGSVIIAIAYGIYMGVKAYNGEMKKYFLVGDWAYKKVYGKS